MRYEYYPTGVCSSKMIFEIEDNQIISLEVIGGCPGNAQGISALCKNRSIDEVISLLSGIRCGNKITSCPDQIAQALKNFKKTVEK